MKQVIHKHEAQKNSGSCVAICWIPKSQKEDEYFLVTAFGSGKVISYLFVDNSLCLISEISLGVTVSDYLLLKNWHDSFIFSLMNSIKLYETLEINRSNVLSQRMIFSLLGVSMVDCDYYILI